MIDALSLAVKTRETASLTHLSVGCEGGLYCYQGAVRQTKRTVKARDRRYLDLHPGEEIPPNLWRPGRSGPANALSCKHTFKGVSELSAEDHARDHNH